MSDTLFGLIGDVKELYDMMTETDEETQQTVKDTLEAVIGQIEVKAEGYVSILNQLDMEIDACKKMRDEWDARLRVRENNKKYLRQHLLEGMLMLGKDEIQAGDVKIKVKNAGGELPLVLDETKAVPERFTKVTIEPDKKKIKAALKAGEKLDFCHYGERAKTIKIG